MKIDHINIVVRDLEKAKEFFVDLGFVVQDEGFLEGEWLDKVTGLKQAKAEYAALGFPGRETNLELLTYYSPQGDRDTNISNPNQIGLRHMAIEVKDIKQIAKKLKAKGYTFLSDIQVYKINKQLCYFLGPEGIILELAEYER